MNAVREGERELVAFDGAVRSQSFSGAVNLVLSGHSASPTDLPVQALLSGVQVVRLPATLEHARLLQPQTHSAADSHQLLIEIAGQRTPLTVHAVQIHRDVARPFYAALPGERITLLTRLGWTLLLWLLRVPGAPRLLLLLRGSK